MLLIIEKSTHDHDVVFIFVPSLQYSKFPCKINYACEIVNFCLSLESRMTKNCHYTTNKYIMIRKMTNDKRTAHPAIAQLVERRTVVV